MNIVLKSSRPNGFDSNSGKSSEEKYTGEWYVVSVRMTSSENWGVRGKILNEDGSLHMECDERFFASLESAKKHCRKRIKRKKAMGKYVDAGISDLPEEAIKHLEPDCESWMTPEDMLKMITESRMERYVWFKDLTGIEEYFRFGLEYLAYVTDEPRILSVIDEYGTKRECMTDRFEKIEYTEVAEEAISKFSNLSI